MSKEEEQCPVCKTDRYLNPTMTLLVNLTCFHKMCESCINRFFSTGSGPCPVCRAVLKKTDFIKSQFEDILVEKECRIRKRVQRMYSYQLKIDFLIGIGSMNKRLEDFGGNLGDFNDYLEEVEETVFNLVNNINLVAINEKLELLSMENANLIQKNLELQQNEDRLLTRILEEEQEDYRHRKEKDLKLLRLKNEESERKKQLVIDQLAASNMAASSIVKAIENDSIMLDITKALGDTDDSEERERGPSLVKKLASYRENLVRLQELSNAPNTFENPLESEFFRFETPEYHDSFDDPSLESLKDESVRSGGFSAHVLYKKAIDSITMSLVV